MCCRALCPASVWRRLTAAVWPQQGCRAPTSEHMGRTAMSGSCSSARSSAHHGRGDGALRVACCMRDDSPGAVAQGDGALGAPITTNAAAICGGQRLQRWRDRSHRERTPTVAVRRADVGARRPHGGIHWPLALVLQRILVAVRCARDHGRSDQRSSGSGHLRERLEGESIWPRRRCRALCPASVWRRTTATMMSREHGVASRRASTEGRTAMSGRLLVGVKCAPR